MAHAPTGPPPIIYRDFLKKIAALEIAERLHALDTERDRTALLQCIRDRRNFTDMKCEYDEYTEQHPE